MNLLHVWNGHALATYYCSVASIPGNSWNWSYPLENAETIGSQCFQIQLTCHRSTTHSIESKFCLVLQRSISGLSERKYLKIFSWRQVPRPLLPSTIFAYPPKFLAARRVLLLLYIAKLFYNCFVDSTFN